MNQVFSRIAILGIAATTLFSCKKDDNSSNNGSTDPNELIIGKWQLTSAQSDKPFAWTSSYTGTDGVAANGPCMKSATLTFSKGTTAGTGTVLFYDDCNKANSSNTYILQNNLLTVTGYQYTVKELNSSKLALASVRVVNGTSITITNSYEKK